MDDQGATPLSGASSELVERGDLDELTRHVGRLAAAGDWAELAELRGRCRLAYERGKQLWPVAAHIEYRLALEAPGYWCALMLETTTGRFSLGPLPEVAASSHSWAELSPHLHGTPQAAMAAHERALRGEDLTADPVATRLPEVLDLPLRLEPWEPTYALAEYGPDKVGTPSPFIVPSGGRPRGRRPARPPGEEKPGDPGRQAAGREVAGRPVVDAAACALLELVSAWTEESNGRAAAIGVPGLAADAVNALGPPPTLMTELAPPTALAWMAWAAASGGAYGRRRGAAPGRFSAWWALAELGGVAGDWPPAPAYLGEFLGSAHWYAWSAGQPGTGWALRLAVEVVTGTNKGRAWAIDAADAA